jgi:basic amino acid/polyamine antiporter, APA family
VGMAGLLLLVGEYSYVLLPPLAGHAVAVAFTTLTVLTVLNWRSVRDGGRIQVVTTVAKTLALGALVAAAFLMPHPPVASAAPPPVTSHGIALLSAFALAMPGVIFAFDSYYYPIFFGEELRDPGREIPRAMFRGLAVIIVMYLLLNAAFLWVLPIAGMANEPFVGGAVAKVLFGVHGDQIIRIIVIVSVLGTINGILLGTSRGLLAMGRDGLFAHHVTRVNAGGTPTVALLLSTVTTAAFLLSGTFGAVLGVFALLLGVNLLLMCISLIVLRRREPDAPRPYRAWGYPWTTWAAIFIGVVFIVTIALSDQHNGMIALAIVLASYPVYRGTRRLFQLKR